MRASPEKPLISTESAVEPGPLLEHGLETAKIQQVDIRREGARTVVEVAIEGEAHARQYAFDSHESGLSFYRAIWTDRQRSLDPSRARD